MTTPLNTAPQNPLLDFRGLPRFDLITPEHVRPAISGLLESGRELVARLTQPEVPATWQDFAAPLSEGLEPFSRAWARVSSM